MDELKNVIAKALLENGATGVRLMDGGVDAIFAGSTFRIEVERA